MVLTYRPVPPITPSVEVNVVSVPSTAAVASPCIREPMVEPSENVNVTKPKNEPLPFT